MTVAINWCCSSAVWRGVQDEGRGWKSRGAGRGLRGEKEELRAESWPCPHALFVSSRPFPCRRFFVPCSLILRQQHPEIQHTCLPSDVLGYRVDQSWPADRISWRWWSSRKLRLGYSSPDLCLIAVVGAVFLICSWWYGDTYGWRWRGGARGERWEVRNESRMYDPLMALHAED